MEIEVVVQALQDLLILKPCYVCGKRRHLDRDCTQAGNMIGGTSSYAASTQQSVRRGTRRGQGNSQRVRFSGLNAIYDEEGYDYPSRMMKDAYIYPWIHRLSLRQNIWKKSGKETKN